MPSLMNRTIRTPVQLQGHKPSCLIPSLAVALFLAPAIAFAQGLDLSTLREADDDNRNITHAGFTVDQLEDMDIYNQEGKKIAEIEHVLVNGQNEVVAFVVDIKNQKGPDYDVVVEASELTLSPTKKKRFITSMNKTALGAKPAWRD